MFIEYLKKYISFGENTKEKCVKIDSHSSSTDISVYSSEGIPIFSATALFLQEPVSVSPFIHDPNTMIICGTIILTSLSSDGTKIAVSYQNQDNIILIFDTLSGHELYRLESSDIVGHINLVSLSFSHDGSKIAYGYDTNRLVICDVQTNDVLFNIQCYNDLLNAYNSEEDGDINDYDIIDGLYITEFSPDNTKIFTFSFAGYGEIFNVITGCLICTLTSTAYSLYSIFRHAGKFSSDGSKVVVFASDELLFWNTESGDFIGRFCFGSLDCTVFKNYYDKKNMHKASSDSDDEEIHHYDDDCDEYTKTNIIAISPDNKKIAVNYENDLILMDLDLNNCDESSIDIIKDSKNIIKVFEEQRGLIKSITFNHDSSKIITGSDDGFIRIYDTNSRVQIGKLYGTLGPIAEVNFSPDSSDVMSFCESGVISRFNIKLLLFIMSYFYKHKRISSNIISIILYMVGYHDKQFIALLL
jgi:WD40 repeat protein